MKKIYCLLVFGTLLLWQFGASAQGVMENAHYTIANFAFIADEANEYDNLWTAVQVSLLIGLFYLLFWLKEGALD